MLKKILIVIGLVGFLYSKSLVSVYLQKLNHMNRNQAEVFKFIWYNAKKVDLSYTLTAIALVESELGLYKINLSDPSCGIFHKLATEFAKDRGLKPTLWNASRGCERLIKSDALSYKVAERDFQRYLAYWIKGGKSYNTAWKYAIKTYNAGYRWFANKNRTKKANQYYKRVISAIKAIKIYLNKR